SLRRARAESAGRASSNSIDAGGKAGFDSKNGPPRTIHFAILYSSCCHHRKKRQQLKSRSTCSLSALFFRGSRDMAPSDAIALETDLRFPSGPWSGFFIQPWIPGRHTMTLDLTFHDGLIEAQGSDRVGAFTFSGSYDAKDG